jgi:hypothetical protein
MEFTPAEWMAVLGLGVVLGAAGQMIRAIAGLKKASESAAAQHKTLSDCLSPSRLVVSLMIGAVAGLLGAIALGLDPTRPMDADKLMALLGFGYAGADFIDAFMAKAAPGTAGSAEPPPANAPVG